MVVITQQLFVFLLKMTILWCFGGTTIVGNSLCIGKKCGYKNWAKLFSFRKELFLIFFGWSSPALLREKSPSEFQLLWEDIQIFTEFAKKNALHLVSNQQRFESYRFHRRFLHEQKKLERIFWATRHSHDRLGENQKIATQLGSGNRHPG